MPRGVYERKRTEAQSAARGPNPVAAPGRVEVSAPAACERCRWYEPDAGEATASPYGSCVRFPTPVRKRAEQRCGEFKAEEGARS